MERTFAHPYETGALRRLYVRGKQNVQKKLLLQAAACNLALLLRKMIGAGTPRALRDLVERDFFYCSGRSRSPARSRYLYPRLEAPISRACRIAADAVTAKPGTRELPV